MTYFDDVGHFHAKFQLPVSNEYPVPLASPALRRTPRMLTQHEYDFRFKFLQEELTEYQDAVLEGNLAKAADALADLVYVALGTAHLHGFPMNAVWREVCRANLTKERATGSDDPRSKRGSSLDVVKPVDFVPPDVEGCLRRAGWNRQPRFTATSTQFAAQLLNAERDMATVTERLIGLGCTIEGDTLIFPPGVTINQVVDVLENVSYKNVPIPTGNPAD